MSRTRNSRNELSISEPFSVDAVPWKEFSRGERNPNDVIVYAESGRVGVRLTGEGYRKSATMDYWEGEKGA